MKIPPSASKRERGVLVSCCHARGGPRLRMGYRMQQRREFVLNGCMALFGRQVQQASGETVHHSSEEHTAWVGQVLTRMQTIKPGRTRKALLSVFTAEDGLSTTGQQTYVSQDCPYFKINVRFSTVGSPEHDSNQRVTAVEDPRDIIVSISEPFLQFSVTD